MRTTTVIFPPGRKAREIAYPGVSQAKEQRRVSSSGQNLAFAVFIQSGPSPPLWKRHDPGSLKVHKVKHNALSWFSANPHGASRRCSEKEKQPGPGPPRGPWRGSWARLQGRARGRLSEPSTWPCDRGDGSLRPGRSMREEAPGVLCRAAPPPPPARPQRSGPSTPGVGAVDVCGSRACSGRPLWLSRSFHFHRHDGVALGPSGGESAPHRQA